MPALRLVLGSDPVVDDKVLSTRGRSVLEGADVLAEGVQTLLDAFPGAVVVQDELIRPGDPAGEGPR